MNLLIAKRNGMSGEEIAALGKLGFNIIEDARDYLPYKGDKSRVEAVICYQFFNYNDIREFPNLKLIHLTSAGYDHMPLDYIKEKGITLYNARGLYSVPIAEFVLWGVLSLYKEAEYFRAQRAERRWKQLGQLREIGGKTVTILGAGSIATEISKRFSALGCAVTALCRHPQPNPEFFAVKSINELDSLLPDTDILILAAPLTDETYHIMNSQRFALMKKGSCFVNIARGALAETAALISALERGQLSGAVLDVFEEEPLGENHPLWETENVILTPHNAFAGEFNGHRCFAMMEKDLKAWMDEHKQEII
ncbi:MAG: D-2-hydroxyacid dehydrogenase [Ruminococcaceae bacterium]|nr:D-2-hydroxyacid dehydrogenase [Oscillospiraceae bacterium]